MEAIRNEADSLRRIQTDDPALNAALDHLANMVIRFALVFDAENREEEVDYDAATRTFEQVSDAYSAVQSYCK